MNQFSDYCILIFALILSLPFMILWCIAVAIDWIIEKVKKDD